MVILITGASHTGKTLLMNSLIQYLSYPAFSMDHLKMGLIRSHQTDLTPMDDDRLTGYLWPIVREMIKTAVENEQDLIVEGCYVPSDWKQDLSEMYLNNIICICLAMTDNYIRENKEAILAHACTVEKRLEEDGNLMDLSKDNRFYRDSFDCEEVYLIDSAYEKRLEEIREAVLLRVQKAGI